MPTRANILNWFLIVAVFLGAVDIAFEFEVGFGVVGAITHALGKVVR